MEFPSVRFSICTSRAPPPHWNAIQGNKGLVAVQGLVHTIRGRQHVLGPGTSSEFQSFLQTEEPIVPPLGFEAFVSIWLAFDAFSKRVTKSPLAVNRPPVTRMHSSGIPICRPPYCHPNSSMAPFSGACHIFTILLKLKNETGTVYIHTVACMVVGETRNIHKTAEPVSGAHLVTSLHLIPRCGPLARWGD